MSRQKWPGWSLDPDPLDAIPPEPDPPPRKRGTGCAWLAAVLAVVFAASVVPAPQGAAQPLSSLDPARVPAAGTADVRAVGDTVGPLPGAPEPVAVSPVTLAGAPQGEASSFVVAAPALRHGTWAYANPSHGSRYLAIPEGPGWNVTVCGPLGCLDRVSTDAGPELWLQRAGRIGDLAAVMFEEICGPLSPGLCSGSYAITGRADQHPEDPPEHPDDARMRLEDQPLPATSTEDVP